MMSENKCFNHSLPGSIAAVYIIFATIGTISTWTSPVLPKLGTVSPDNPFGYALSSSEKSWIASSLILGSCMGCWLFGYLTNIFGRKWVSCLINLPICISWLVMVIFPTLKVYIVCRCIMGLSLGGGFSVLILYASEITSAQNRSVLCTLIGTFQSLGSLFVYAVGPWITVTSFNMILIIFPIIGILLIVVFGAESPYFYLSTNQEELAMKSLIIYRPPESDIEKELIEIQNQIKEEQNGNILDVIRTKAFLRSFIIGNFLILFQQFTGINCILMYCQNIFDITSSNLTPSLSSIIFAIMQVMSTLLCPYLIRLMDRKNLLFLSCLGMIISEGTLGIYCVLDAAEFDMSSVRFIPITTLILFIFSYNSGIGPLCWLISAEMYATRVKALALSFTIFTFFVSDFFLSKYFYALIEIIGIGNVFFIFTGCCFAAIVFIKLFVIETRDKSLQEIQDILKK